MNKKKLFKTFFIVAIASCVWFYISPPYTPPRDYPPLSESARQRMDLKLFNELVMNGSILPHYTVERRRQLILDMAKQGFEVADLAYQLMNINPNISSGRHHLLPWEWGTYRHLRKLADRGDPSAQCLTALVISRWRLNMRDYERYVVSAAANGQPYCTYLMSGLLSPPSNGWQQTPLDKEKSATLLLLSAKMGVQRARLRLRSLFADGRQGYPLNMGKAKCWYKLAKQADTGATLSEKTTFGWVIRQAEAKGIDVSDRYDPKQWCETKFSD